MKVTKLFAAMLILPILISAASCGETVGSDNEVEVTAPEGRPQPVDPDEVELSDEEFICTISISCQTILDSIDKLDPEKLEIIPEDGYILAPTEAKFYGGESVFNLLRRVCKENRIHMEFANTPIYGTAYIEGIGNIYEFDCGELSGWMYRVNDWFPNYGCSRYSLCEGDIIEFVYTCDLGKDVGGDFSTNRDS